MYLQSIFAFLYSIICNDARPIVTIDLNINGLGEGRSRMGHAQYQRAVPEVVLGNMMSGRKMQYIVPVRRLRILYFLY